MPGDILRCSLPHLIALPCQTRAERAKAPSPVPRSISWQSFESNCDCSALRASASERKRTGKQSRQLLYLPTGTALSRYFGNPASNVCVPCPGLALPLSSLFTDLVSRPSLLLSHTHSLSLSLPPRSDHP